MKTYRLKPYFFAVKKTILIFLLIVLGSISCKNGTKEIDRLQLAKHYYKVLDNSDHTEIKTLLTDSLLTRETEYDYEQTFSLKEYEEWLQWDALFEPTYNILQIAEEGETVKVTVSKLDQRIAFLHKKPIVTDQVLHFKKNKITSIETTNYVIFNDSIFVKNREALVNWIAKNHPELNGFIYDQTKEGGEKYLKAMALYNNRK